MLPLGYESTVTDGNKMRVGSAWVAYFADCGFWFLVCFAPGVAVWGGLVVARKRTCGAFGGEKEARNTTKISY